MLLILSLHFQLGGEVVLETYRFHAAYRFLYINEKLEDLIDKAGFINLFTKRKRKTLIKTKNNFAKAVKPAPQKEGKK